MSPFFRPKIGAKPESVAALESEHGPAMAWGLTVADDPVVATPSCLIVGGAADLNLPWHLIDRAAWSPPSFEVLCRVPGSGAPATVRLELARLGKLPLVVRERVTKSVVISRRFLLQGDLGAVVAARRDAAGSVSWTVSFDPGMNAADPRMQQLAREALSELRRSYGA